MPNIIFLWGMMGSGKSFYGKILAKELNYKFIDIDEEIEKSSGISVSIIFNNCGESFFRDKERDILNIFSKRDKLIISCGGGTPCYFDNIKLMKKKGFCIYINKDIDEIMINLENKDEIKKRPNLAGLEKDKVREYLIKNLKEREYFYKQADLILKNFDDFKIDDFKI